MWKGWISELYILPKFHFSYYGFEWVKTLPGNGMYVLFALLLVAALFITFGLFYRLAAVVFFLLFTYVELIDKTAYLNHYYFVSLISFLLIFMPANRRLSLDVAWLKIKPSSTVPAWTINILKFQLFVVYFYAGAAKLNTDWLIHALPLKIWLPAKSHLPVIGWFLKYEVTAYVFSWAGAIYDLTVPFLLLNKKARGFAFLAVVIFHALTSILFPIGMFPYIMTLSVLIFFSASFHERILRGLEKISGAPNDLAHTRWTVGKPIGYLLVFFCLVQVLFPWRFALYPGHLFWTEQGYRFSWRVMLMEKMGSTTFRVTDGESHKSALVANYDYLTPLQEREMSAQPDMILQFAHFLADEYRKQGFRSPEVTVQSMVTLNGSRSQPFIDPTVNLAAIRENWQHKTWILPYSAN